MAKPALFTRMSTCCNSSGMRSKRPWMEERSRRSTGQIDTFCGCGQQSLSVPFLSDTGALTDWTLPQRTIRCHTRRSRKSTRSITHHSRIPAKTLLLHLLQTILAPGKQHQITSCVKGDDRGHQLMTGWESLCTLARREKRKAITLPPSSDLSPSSAKK